MKNDSYLKFFMGLMLLCFGLLFYLKQSGFFNGGSSFVGSGEIRIRAGYGNHYRIDGTINGQPVQFLIDTGASGVTVNQQLADQLNLPRLGQRRSSTANGTVFGQDTRFDRLTIGDWEFHNLPGGIVPNMEGEALLGMHVLKDFELIQRNGELIIRPTAGRTNN